MHQTLYRKWRPLTFDDVVGQEHVTSILRYQIASGKASHAYLFCGSRGTGKTTCAKILARALNCQDPRNGSPCGVCEICRGILSGAITDVIEMDAASNNGVDNIRDIRDDVAYAPTECNKRVFIIDEVHMLSTSAFNALLKTLEEPPEHVVFILATTEMHKIPATILSRCQRYDFRRIASPVIAARLRTIAESEAIAIEDEALHLIAKLSQGGMRDAIGMLELCAGTGSVDSTPITAVSAAALLGTAPYEETASVVDAVSRRDIAAVFAAVDRLYKESRDVGVFWQSLISFYRDMLVCKTVTDPFPLLDLTDNQRKLPAVLSKRFPLEALLYHTRVLDETISVLKANTSPARITIETALIRLCDHSLDTANDALLSRIAVLEERIARGIAVHPVVSAVTAEIPENTPPVSDTYDLPPVPTDGFPEASDTGFPDDVPPPWEAPVQEPITVSPPAQRAHTAKPVTVDTVKAAVPAESMPQQQKKTLRAFGSWQGAMTRLEKHNPMTASFLRECKAYTCADDGKFYIRTANAFTAKLITSKKENIDQLLGVLNVLAKDKTYTEAELVIEAADSKKNDGYEMIDEIIDNLGAPDDSQ